MPPPRALASQSRTAECSPQAYAAGAQPAAGTESARACRVLYVLMFAYIAASYAAAASIGRAGQLTVLLYSREAILACVIFFLLFLAWRATVVMVVQRPRQLAPALYHDLRSRYFTAERCAQAVPLFVVLSMFLSVFSCMKALIPQFHALDWDARLHAADVWLHGGTAPWALLQPLFGQPLLSGLLNLMYNLWFAVLIWTLLWQVLSLSQPRLKLQFLTTFVLAWAIEGTLLATLFASAGPCFYGNLNQGENPYAALMDYLHQADARYRIWALATQDYLWRAHVAADLLSGAGISAMPSVHVATATAIALLAWRKHRLFGWAMWLFTAAICAGSVHLAWHYAIDGYVAILTTTAIWWVAGRLSGHDTIPCG